MTLVGLDLRSELALFPRWCRGRLGEAALLGPSSLLKVIAPSMRAEKATGERLRAPILPSEGEMGEVADEGDMGKSKASERGVLTSRSKLYMEDLREREGVAAADGPRRSDFRLELFRRRGEAVSTFKNSGS